jgi:hypothetical protein
MSWTDSARSHIATIHDTLPADATFDQRVKALRDSYPFQMRSGWAYKAWLKARKEYLAKYATPTTDTKQWPLSPLERMIAKAKSHCQ